MTQTHNKIEKLLIANRGEISLRVQRAAQKLAIRSVMVASDVDKNAYFARHAEELVVIGTAPATESYLNISKLLEVARATGCNAVHPGYGFLSESAIFARAVADAGLIFVGPSSEAIRILGSKTEARARAIAVGVPCVPGAKGALSDQELIAIADDMGYPVLIKATSGGGGRGMRVAHAAEELEALLPRARAEALKNFGDGEVFIERYIECPRHVEVQLFGDHHGAVVHFGTRDCSTQRRHQKLVEEAPAPDLSPILREEVQQAAVKVAKAVDYYNAGTAEFLVRGEQFYFLEMNTRIQVEHPVTEAVTGVDLVELQLRVAQGEHLPMAQDAIRFDGHAIEFRIYAEDPANNFSPSIGPIESIIHVEKAADVREDFGFDSGDTITPYYDAMLCKLIVHAPTRREAVARSREVLQQYAVTGVTVNTPFFRWLLRLSTFKNAPVDIGYIEREFGKEALRALRASEIHDPQHCAPIAGALHKEIFEYGSKRYAAHYLIQVTHRADGLFEATAADTAGRWIKKKHRRLSNGLEAVMQALTRDVLETVSPTELFD